MKDGTDEERGAAFTLAFLLLASLYSEDCYYPDVIDNAIRGHWARWAAKADGGSAARAQWLELAKRALDGLEAPSE